MFNPVFERALHGPGTAHGWNFEPAMLLRCATQNIFAFTGILRGDREHQCPATRAAGGAPIIRWRRLGLDTRKPLSAESGRLEQSSSP